MSKGKYSPTVYHKKHPDVEFEFNCFGNTPEEWDKENYDEQTMFPNYDYEGFDCYGYSAFSREGKYVGIGQGIDRNGLSENDYLDMSDEEFEYHC